MSEKIHQYYVYLLTNKGNRVIYVGFTNDIKKRIWEHKEGIYENSFTKKYGCNKLVITNRFNGFIRR